MTQGVFESPSLVFRPEAFVICTFTSASFKLYYQCPHEMSLIGFPSRGQNCWVCIAALLLCLKEVTVHQDPDSQSWNLGWREGSDIWNIKTSCNSNLLILRTPQCRIPTAFGDVWLPWEPDSMLRMNYFLCLLVSLHCFACMCKGLIL